MDEVDVEDADDLNELEARLYAQIHHEASDSCDVSSTYKEASPVRLVTQTSVINNKSIDRTSSARYWNNKASLKSASREVTQSVEQRDANARTPNKNGETNEESPAETVDKSFPPLVKNLSKLRANPIASGNGPKAKGSSTQPTRVVKHANPLRQKSKNFQQKEIPKGPFSRQLAKLSHAMKYEEKKQKAKIAKGKAFQKASSTPIKATNTSFLEFHEPIDLLSSNESEADDVIEVPLPSPTILTIDSSSDNDESVAEDKNDFVMPQSPTNKENPSSCTSPCSVISDDFIGQSDRSRLQQEQIIPDDEDLVLLQEDMDSLIDNAGPSLELSSDSFVAPSQASDMTKADYRVTQNDFRALDVYESESDIQESVYSKGQKVNKNPMVIRLEHESSSDDDVEEVDITQKTKRLRKRRASSTNKESETYIDSTDSEQEDQVEKDHDTSRDVVGTTRLPYIARGEAIERYVNKDQTPNKSIINSSDNEFITTLNNLAQGTPIPAVDRETESHDDDEEEQITARAIAEDVIEKHTRAQANQSCEVENEAIPNDSIIELEKVFEQIDSMVDDRKKDDAVGSPADSDDSVELVAPIPVPKRKESRSARRKLARISEDPVYNVVYCSGTTVFDGIGWNDEMQRFYNYSWNGERFNVKAICSRMKATKSLWKIYTEDRFPKYRKHSNTKCLNCCEFGHTRAKCPNPKKVPVCFMCGERGHHEPRCPNTVCLRCGNKTRMFTKSCNACNYQNRLICPICKVRGHNLNFCPDKWRRYHSTTKPNEYPNNDVEYKMRKFCCVCGCRGHWAEHCRNSIRFSEYPVFISDVRSHQKSYNDIPVNSIRSGIGYNLMYKPREDISFELAENKTKQQYYGRFLSAVGLGYMLTRKRRGSATERDKASKNKQPRLDRALKDYVVNPFAKAALETEPATSTNSLNSMNISSPSDEIINVETDSEQMADTIPNEESVIENIETTATSMALLSPEPHDQIVLSNEPNEDIYETEANMSAFKTPNVVVGNIQAEKEPDPVEIIDSDSNYSFSDHFESAKPTQPSEEETPRKSREMGPLPDSFSDHFESAKPTQPSEEETPRKSREMGPLPDFISINDDSIYNDHNTGISKTFVSADTDEENSNAEHTPMPDIPCRAKIYLTTFHSKFLLLPEGSKFLTERSKLYDIKASLDWTSVGHVLVIFGQRANQDKFHTDLLHKFRELSDKLNRKQLENSQKVPRKKEVLIRFLREHINQLLTNLGNVNDLYKRLSLQENQHTKAGWKLAERTRRLLNMILIGQAGLRNGAWHLDNLISHLRNLIDSFKDDVVPNDIRDDIDANWKLIFSSHRHDKYQELIEAYNHMQTKNRLQCLTIDPRLLGKKALDTSLTKTQKENMEKIPSTDTNVEQPTTPKLVPNPISVKNQPRTPRNSLDKKRLRNSTINSPSSSAVQSSPLSGNQKQPSGQFNTTPVANKGRAINAKWDKCVNLLSELDNTGKNKKGTPTRDGKAISVFWSREAMKYIDECMQLANSNTGLTEKLARVQEKSQKGLLSYNDYRAIIKIHNSMKGKQ